MSERTTLALLVADPRPYLDDPDPALRRLAASACAAGTDDATRGRLVSLLEEDPAPEVRRECAEALRGLGGSDVLTALLTATKDDEMTVREAAAAALGETADSASLPRLIELATGDDTVLVREAAVASLGAIGDESAVPTLLALAGGAPPDVRRRCVMALSVFEGDEVEAAIRAATTDRSPIVREAARLVTGGPPE